MLYFLLSSCLAPWLIGAGISSTTLETYLHKLAQLPTAPHIQDIPYDRKTWRHWVDADGDCQNTRAEVLVAESTIPVTFRTDKSCTVHTGLWFGPWGGEERKFAGDLDIDHHVPLLNAHRSGGAHWSATAKRAYANDLALAPALQATQAAMNRLKGGKGPEAWKPPATQAWCTYAQNWIDVKTKYHLTVTSAEQTALHEMLATCPTTASAHCPN